MKPTAGSSKLRRVTAPTGTRLNLQRRPKPSPDDDLDDRSSSPFWKWVLLVALLHLAAIAIIYLVFEFAPASKPPEQFISLLPPGDTVKGSPGKQQAHNLGATIPPVAIHHTPAPQPRPVPTPPVIKPPPVAAIPLTQPLPHIQTTSLIPDQPIVKPPPKPAPPKPPRLKVKVDLNLVDAPSTTEPKPVKHHPKKPVEKTEETQDNNTPEVIPLSKAMIAEKLGDKTDAEGIKDAQKTGSSGSLNGNENRFQDYYAMIAEQIHDAWNGTMVPVEVVPIVGMHVERDGHVLPESVHLIRSSGSEPYDDAALATVRGLGFLREPLPEGCPADMTINFHPTF